MKQFSYRFILFLLLLTVTAVEKVYGLPVIASTIFLFLIAQLSRPLQFVIGLTWGIVIATLFVGPFWACLLCICLAIEMMQWNSQTVVQQQLRIVLVSILLMMCWLGLLHKHNFLSQVLYTVGVGGFWLTMWMMIWGIRKRPSLQNIAVRMRQTQDW